MSIVYVVLTALVVVIASVMILKKVDSKLVFLFIGTLALFLATAVNGTSVLGDATTGNMWLDVIDVIRVKFIGTLKGTGIRLMMVAGYVLLMNHVKASNILAASAGKWLVKLKSPYLVLAGVFILGSVLKVFIPSQISLGLLFMATMYPILLRLGVSKISCAAVLVSIGMLDMGPNDSSAIFGATDVMGIAPMDYFLNYELKIGAIVVLATAVFYAVYFNYRDRKEFGPLVSAAEAEVEHTAAEDYGIPKLYGLFPLVPLTLVVVFSFIETVEMDVITANVIGFFLFFLVDLIVRKDLSMVMDNLKQVWVWMGEYFYKIVVLIASAGVFAEAIKQLKGIDILAEACARLTGASLVATVALSLIVFGTALLTGSGNAPWFAFGPLTPGIASALGTQTATFSVSMHLAGGIGRSFSPFCGGMIAVSGLAELEVGEVCRRNMFPMIFAYVVNVIASYVVFTVL